jgi:hypothetical protein
MKRKTQQVNPVSNFRIKENGLTYVLKFSHSINDDKKNPFKHLQFIDRMKYLRSVGPKKADETATLVTVKHDVDFYMLSKNAAKRLYPRRGVTKCNLVIKDESHNIVYVETGTAECSWKDAYVKSKGSKVAFGNMLKNLSKNAPQHYSVVKRQLVKKV